MLSSIDVLPHQNPHIVCAGNHSLAAIDFYQMMLDCDIPSCEINAFGFKSPNIAWATQLMSDVRGEDPQARIVFDLAAEYDPEECPDGPFDDHYAILVKHSPSFALANEWTTGTANHYMLFPQVQAELTDFGQVPCFGTCLLTNPGKISPMLMAIEKLKVYSTIHH